MINPVICDNVGEFERHYIKQSNPGTKTQTPFDLTYLWNLKKLISSDLKW
jgi:hypothetical protein